jgi:hypothetical protein
MQKGTHSANVCGSELRSVQQTGPDCACTTSRALYAAQQSTTERTLTGAAVQVEVVVVAGATRVLAQQASL